VSGRAPGNGTESELSARCDGTDGLRTHIEKFPPLTGDDLVKFLEFLDFRVIRVHGSHVRLVANDGRATTVPIHARRELPRGLLHAIIRELEMSRTNFFRLWTCYSRA
jgi:predicted RNA binding protein YcfA (HicA-like mRNA interferase family)